MNSGWEEEDQRDGKMMECLVGDTYSLIPSDHSDSFFSRNGPNEMGGEVVNGSGIPFTQNVVVPSLSKLGDLSMNDATGVSDLTNYVVGADDTTTTTLFSSVLDEDDDDGDQDDDNGNRVQMKSDHVQIIPSIQSQPILGTPPVWKLSRATSLVPEIQFLGTPPTIQTTEKELLQPKSSENSSIQGRQSQLAKSIKLLFINHHFFHHN